MIGLGSGYVAANAPSYAPSSLANVWSPTLSMYNRNPALFHKWWAAAQKSSSVAGIGSQSCHIGVYGDSTMVGYNGTIFDGSKSIPYLLGQKLAAKMGCNYMQGLRSPIAAKLSGANDEWTALTGTLLTGTNAAGSLITGFGGASATATWTGRATGTSVGVIVSNLSTTGIAWTIDAVAQGAITTDGSSTFKYVQVDGLANTAHTIVFTKANAANLFLGSPRVFTPGTIGTVFVHDMAIGGARANSGTPDQNFSDITSTGLGSVQPSQLSVAGITLDLLLVCIGNNDAFQSVSAANILLGQQNIRGYHPTVPVLFIRPPMVPATDTAIFTALSTGMFTQADTLGTAFFDWNNFVQTTTNYLADGLAGADNIHPTFPHQLGVANMLANILSPWQ